LPTAVGDTEETERAQRQFIKTKRLTKLCSCLGSLTFYELAVNVWKKLLNDTDFRSIAAFQHCILNTNFSAFVKDSDFVQFVMPSVF